MASLDTIHIPRTSSALLGEAVRLWKGGASASFLALQSHRPQAISEPLRACFLTFPKGLMLLALPT